MGQAKLRGTAEIRTKEGIAKRKAAWTQPAPRYTHGVLAKYAKLVSTASEGAVTDKYL